MHTRPRRTDRRTNIMATAQRFVLTNASRANINSHYRRGDHKLSRCVFSSRAYMQ